MLLISASRAPHIPSVHKPIHNLPDKEFIEELLVYNGISEEILQTPEMIELFLPLLRADFSITETYPYIPSDPLPYAITVLGGFKDPKVSQADLEGWGKHTTAQFSMRIFPGDHFFLWRDKQTFDSAIFEEFSYHLNKSGKKVRRIGTVQSGQTQINASSDDPRPRPERYRR